MFIVSKGGPGGLGGRVLQGARGGVAPSAAGCTWGCREIGPGPGARPVALALLAIGVLLVLGGHITLPLSFQPSEEHNLWVNE